MTEVLKVELCTRTLVCWSLPIQNRLSSTLFQVLGKFTGTLGCLFSSVKSLSHSVVSDSLRPHGLQHARPPCPSPTPGVYPNSCPLSRWCHPTVSSSVVPSPPSLSLSQHQGLSKWVSSLHQVAKVLVSASTSVLPMNTQDWSSLGWTGVFDFFINGFIFVTFKMMDSLCSLLL